MFSFSEPELTALHDCWERKQKREDYRAGRAAAVIVNLVGSAFSKDFKPITEEDIFPLWREREEERAELEREIPEESPGTQALLGVFRAEQEEERKRKLNEALARVNRYGAKKRRIHLGESGAGPGEVSGTD